MAIGNWRHTHHNQFTLHFMLTFTDGSRSNKGAGCAFVANGATRSFSLPNDASVFTTELVAISKALCFIEVGDEDLHLIYPTP